MDRNIHTQHLCICVIVALRKESVDRNSRSLGTLILVHMSLSARRAWIEIDRLLKKNRPSVGRSLSARRAWIEIVRGISCKTAETVALRKESVDRNRQNYECFEWIKASLSARRAWIEITVIVILCKRNTPSLSARRAWIEMIDYIIDYVNDAVALRKESVDRNSPACSKKIGRLLVALRKESVDRNKTLSGLLIGSIKSLSARRAWIEMTQCRL